VIVTGPIFARIALALLAGVILQIAVISQVTVFGTSPDIVPVLIVVLGLLGGSMVGATAGFGCGLLLDSLLLQTLGASSLILLGVGYLAGRFRELFDTSNPLVPPLLAGGLTLLAVSGFSLLQFMLGVDAPVSVLLVRDAILKSLFNVFLSVPIYLGMRRLLRPALIDDYAGRRSRFGGLGVSKAA
jgi:rod shape-determining protein MreD